MSNLLLSVPSVTSASCLIYDRKKRERKRQRSRERGEGDQLIDRAQSRTARRLRCLLPLTLPHPLTMKTKPKGARAKNMDKLIMAVQARECLWDKSYRGHRNRFKLERYWNEVAAEVGTTSE